MKAFFLPFLIFLGLSAFFFSPFIINHKLPIPSDTIVGLYHPFRDQYAKEYPRGIPFKNSLITDPVRQQYPWKNLSIETLKKLEVPIWNPYTFAGTPLLANVQSSAFYPLNVFYFILPFSVAWSFLIFLQPVLAGFFMYLFLSRLGLLRLASFLGGFVYSYCGFAVSWLTWNTIVHTALWLPLILFLKEELLTRRKIKWLVLFCFAESSLILAGHLQTLFYALIISNSYLLARVFQNYGAEKKKVPFVSFLIESYKPFLFLFLIVFLITAFQLVPALQFIAASARDVDQQYWQQEGWFIPWQHIIQFIAPDFFGNPSTGNYWGAWNYGEFVGYVGIVPLLFSLFALFFRRDKKTIFFGTFFFLSLIFAFPTFFAKIPFVLSIPFLSTAQPTRLLFLTDFSLAVLAGLGFDLYLRKEKGIEYPFFFLLLAFSGLWLFVFLGIKNPTFIPIETLLVARQNLLLPTIIFFTLAALFLAPRFLGKLKKYLLFGFILLTVFDLFRFGMKFTPFTEKSYLFPKTATISFLQKKAGLNRIMTTDSRLLPPNFSLMYGLFTVDGYDPLYLRRYAEVIAASERGVPDITPPFGFNRIITPHRVESPIVDLLGVRYVLSLSDLSLPKLKKVFQEGQTRVYENTAVFPRAFFVSGVQKATSKTEAIRFIYENDLRKQAVVETPDAAFGNLSGLGQGRANIDYYSSNSVVIKTDNKKDGFLVLTDSFYPSWHATVDGKATVIYKTDYNFRGVMVPTGKHAVRFTVSLF